MSPFYFFQCLHRQLSLWSTTAANQKQKGINTVLSSIHDESYCHHNMQQLIACYHKTVQPYWLKWSFDSCCWRRTQNYQGYLFHLLGLQWFYCKRTAAGFEWNQAKSMSAQVFCSTPECNCCVQIRPNEASKRRNTPVFQNKVSGVKVPWMHCCNCGRFPVFCGR